MTSHVDEQIAARIARVTAERAARGEERAEFGQARAAGLEARKRAKMRRIFCCTCAKLQRRNTYLRCPLGCGGVVCRKNPHCGNTHLKQCDNRPEAS